MTSTCQFLFSECKCIANSGGDSAGSLTFHYPPTNKPNQFLVNDCQFINNKLTSSSTYGGAGIYFDGTYSWMNGIKFITFCFFDGNTATNGRGNDVFFNGSSIIQSPFNQCGSTTLTQRVWNCGTATNDEYNSWLPHISTYKIVSNNGTNTELCGMTRLRPCSTIEYALVLMTDTRDASITLLSSIFVPSQTLTFISNTIFSTCSVSEDTSSGGRGGALMIEFNHGSQVSESSFSITNIVFSANKASVGRDVYFVCESFVASVKEPLFAFMGNITQKDNSIVGHDRTEAFGDWDIDLFIFIDGYFADKVFVDGTSGVEEKYCGLEKAPCLSVNYGMERLKRPQNVLQEIVVCSKSKVEGCENMSGLSLKANTETIVEIECQREVTGFEECILKSTSLTEMEFIGIAVTSSFSKTITSVIESSTQNGVLHMKNCEMSVFGGKRNTIEFFLIKSTGKMVELEFVTISNVKSTFSLFSFSLFSANMNEQECKLKLLNCILKELEIDGSGEAAVFGGSMGVGMVMNGSRIEGAVSKTSKKGGALKIALREGGYAALENSLLIGCVCENGSEGGKGGGIYLDCQNCLNEKPFLFDIGVTFENNNAAIGKNVFILGKDLNSSVTNDSFKFDYSSMKDDKTLFVGSDNFHSNKDLFMFLIPYSSFEIFISSEGFDVARCGSEEESCFSMWKGMENMEKEIGMKTIQIEGSTVIRDSFDVSNYQIKKGVKMGEENVKAILNIEKAIGNQLECFMENDIHLELTIIQLQLTSGFDNSAKTIISNKNGDLVITGCAFHSEARVNNGFDCVFVDAIGGSVEVSDLSIESCNVGNSIFSINNVGVYCHLMNIRVESLNESRGCILSIKKSEPELKINEGVNEECVNIEIEKSSFSGVKKSDNGPSILELKSENKICFVVNESSITEDKAETSEKGGAIFFTLGTSGSMKMVDSTISHCSCSNSVGRGGGVYLATKERGELDFSFVKMKFSANTARVGNDIFIECFNITSQINESQFQFDLREDRYTRMNAIYGIDSCEHTNDTDLIDFVTIHQSDTIIVSSVNGSNERQCGTNTLPCYSIDHGLMHLTSDFMSQMIVVEGSVIGCEINLEEMSLSSKRKVECKVEMKSEIDRTKDSVISTTGEVSLLRVSFVFDLNFISSHESLISPEGGILEIINCSFDSKQSTGEGNIELANIPFHIINMEKGELQLDGCSVSNLILQETAFYLSSQLPSVIDSLTFCNSTMETSLIDIKECGKLNVDRLNTENITVEGNEESLISCLSMKKTMRLTNCTMGGVSSNKAKGKLMKLKDCLDVRMDSCIFDGSSKERNEKNLNAEEEEMCRWDGSLVDVVKSSVLMKDATISNSPDGGITISGGEITVDDGRFENNNPSIEVYPSLRRNIICSDSGTLNVMSLKGGDGWKDNTSLWMLNEGCSFEGIASERGSSFFIPVLESVEAKDETDRMKLIFKGLLLVPCNLSFSVVKRKGEEKELEKHNFDGNGFLSEREVEGSATKDLISSCEDEMEVSVHILFGNPESPSSTNSFILKNASEIEQKGDEIIVEGGKEGKSSWAVICLIFAVLFVIVLVALILFVVRWRKVKNEAENLREIVNDTVRKDPKAFEMVTMEMSPEEQWRRAEREAEKKNCERIKKKVFEKSLAHSESEEYLLSESGSTEYILGKYPDKIPDWALEKEEEEIRKRTPSPSISSTCSTDSDSTFVRSESLCPTTSSMSNLVDAMACSSPHEKLIVDLRDSLFMLLHGRNEKKEMAIGSLKEREQTAAQILFWVANLALHSFDEMENPLQSLANLKDEIEEEEDKEEGDGDGKGDGDEGEEEDNDDDEEEEEEEEEEEKIARAFEEMWKGMKRGCRRELLEMKCGKEKMWIWV
ncbi:uncharacterized protein MONOS_5008 [Monocercomonoides exilis]|uniref:uncharacterized protein n=1 Tax=Monocercomonoides exilis TaxID=2049356 RepID=UPI003559A0E7|nr:hypothetical protein MONOS_5008 [Monocercomonoides exilis]|eukprot:MONOS_5008.1-p1 / transcript=MONOS_5008.1 / gene=MONOS_5008 / organism=Monocercomonoides_exilis_PA203 / gene_product=unspecified product / transcript_product=unspecified product / location=Mono_scaffold00141:6325-13081(+) / protein_length=1873 / sequence_SO=supercontig / SO=protein_coding / is_pseudo=false